MASRIMNRRALRDQVDQAALAEKAVPDGAVAVVTLKKKRKAPATPRVKKPRAKKLPPRMCARWCVFDGAMKQVAIFDYNQRAAADEKLADLLAKKKGHFMQIVKEPMAEPVNPEEPLVAASA